MNLILIVPKCKNDKIENTVLTRSDVIHSDGFSSFNNRLDLPLFELLFEDLLIAFRLFPESIFLDVEVGEPGVLGDHLVVMLPGPLSGEMSVVGGSGVGHAPCAARVEMTQEVGQPLQVVGRHVAVIPQDVVVGGAAGALNSLMGQEVVVALSGVVDALVNHSARDHVTVPVHVVLVVGRGEEASVMPLLNHQVGDERLVTFLQLSASSFQSLQFSGQNLEELSLADSISEHDDPFWLSSLSACKEFLEKLDSDRLHILDDFLVLFPRLHPDLNLVSRGVWILRSYHSGNAGFGASVLGGRVGHIRAHDHDGSIENRGSAITLQDVILPSEFGVHLEAKIGENLKTQFVFFGF